MKLTDTLRLRIATAIQDDYKRKSADGKYSQSRHATYLSINGSAHSRILNGDTDKILAEDQWIRIGRKLGVDLTGQDWKTAPTVTYNTIQLQMAHCKEKSVARFFCDLIGIGKTHAATDFVRSTVNAVYVNCKLYRTHHQLVRAIAAAFGFESKGRFLDVREGLISNILTLDRPFIVLDDGGYLKDEALLEVIALWDETEQMCGWYILGEPAFKKRLENMILKERLGWEAWFSRFGGRIMSVTDTHRSDAEIAAMKRFQAEQILSVNMPGASAKKQSELLTESKCNLRTLRDDINKHKILK